MFVSYLKNKHQSSFSLPLFLVLAVGIIFGFSFAFIWMSTWKLMKSVPNAAESKIYYTIDSSRADDIHHKVRILCWVVTSPANHITKAAVIKRTWGSRCNTLLFISSEVDKTLPTLALNTNQMWSTTIETLTYIHEHYIEDADWFLKADDENFIVVENLRHMLKPHDPDSPSHFGRRFSKHLDQGYMSSGAAYVMSREAVKRFVEVALRDPDKCNQGIGLDDVELGKCLNNVGVVAGDSKDQAGMERFYPFMPEVHLSEEYLVQIPWFFEYINSSNIKESQCCSQTTISFHDVPPDSMYVYDYLLHDLSSLQRF